MELTNKVAVVTGGASGLGQAACQQLVKRGAKFEHYCIDGKCVPHIREWMQENGYTPDDITDILDELHWIQKQNNDKSAN